jgi:hypothetical protein
LKRIRRAHSNLGISLTDLGQLTKPLAHYQTAIDLIRAARSALEPVDAVPARRFTRGLPRIQWRLLTEKNVRVTHEGPRWDGCRWPAHALLEAEQGMATDSVRPLRRGDQRHDGRIIFACEAARAA